MLHVHGKVIISHGVCQNPLPWEFHIKYNAGYSVLYILKMNMVRSFLNNCMQLFRERFSEYKLWPEYMNNRRKRLHCKMHRCKIFWREVWFRKYNMFAPHKPNCMQRLMNDKVFISLEAVSWLFKYRISIKIGL